MPRESQVRVGVPLPLNCFSCRHHCKRALWPGQIRADASARPCFREVSHLDSLEFPYDAVL